MIPYTLNDTGITFFLKGQKTFAKDHPRYEELKAAVIAGDATLVDRIANPKMVVARASAGKIVISTDDEVLFNGIQLPEYMAKRILEHHDAGEPIEPLCAFAEKLMSNPNESVRTDLYRWVENGKMPVYADGDFMAYKRVSAQYTPLHHGGMYGQSQKVGEIVTQPRETCDENRSNTCSSGLHFCSYDYLPQFHSGSDSRIIVLKINPRDVTSIPTDYNLTKGRTCRFEVVDEVPFEEIRKVFGGHMVLRSLGTYQPDADEHEGYDAGQEPAPSSGFTNKLGITAEQVWAALEAAGGVIKQAATDLGVGRSTLSEWIKKIGKKPEEKAGVETDEELDAAFDDAFSDDSWAGDDEEDDDLLDDDIDLVSFDEPAPTVESELGEKAREAVDRLGSQTKAAAELGVSRSTIARWLKK